MKASHISNHLHTKQKKNLDTATIVRVKVYFIERTHVPTHHDLQGEDQDFFTSLCWGI